MDVDKAFEAYGISEQNPLIVGPKYLRMALEPLPYRGSGWDVTPLVVEEARQALDALRGEVEALWNNGLTAEAIAVAQRVLVAEEELEALELANPPMRAQGPLQHGLMDRVRHTVFSALSVGELRKHWQQDGEDFSAMLAARPGGADSGRYIEHQIPLRIVADPTVPPDTIELRP